MVKFTIKKRSALVLAIVSVYSSIVSAEFLEMPEIEQFRDSEERTLLRDLDIPAVRDRSPDPAAGPRLAVSKSRSRVLSSESKGWLSTQN